MLHPIETKPRWPDRKITINNAALEALCKAQDSLPPSIRLVITRAYQPEGRIRKLSRQLGKYIFALAYPARHTEVAEIFGHNGHATDGNHVDVAIRYNGRLLKFLPLGVFTPLSAIQCRKQQYREIIQQTAKALVTAGFSVHSNPTEALQIHCDFIS